MDEEATEVVDSRADAFSAQNPVVPADVFGFSRLALNDWTPGS